MKKILSLILAMVMMATAVAAFAETGSEVTEEDLSSLLSGLMGGSGEGADESGLGDLLSGLMGGSGEGADESGLGDLLSGLMGGSEEGAEGSGLGSLLGGLMSKLSGGEGGFNLSSILQRLLERLAKKLSSLKGGKLSEIIAALKQKLSSRFGGTSRNTEGGSDMDLSSLLNGLLGGLAGGSEEGGESADLSALLGLLGGGSDESGDIGEEDMNALLGLLLGEENGEDFDLDAFLEAYRASPEYQEYLARFEARNVYLIEKHADLEKGDEQVVVPVDISNFEIDDPNREFGIYTLVNFAADGKDLKEVSRCSDVLLLTYEKQEDGTFKVVNVVIAEEGEGRDASIQAMCDAYGVPIDDYNDCADDLDYHEREYFIEFLENHPEYERIEYKGELKTLDELQAIQDAYWAEIEAMMKAQ